MGPSHGLWRRAGASMNPVRSFDPALTSDTWTDFWVYLATPVLGSALGAFAYQLIRGENPPCQLHHDQSEVQPDGAHPVRLPA
jgi:hypothetical protein